jgi:glycosyltransferase involved in cell wall biosynthesis
MMEKGISVIICCYNSAERIPFVLEQLAKQKQTEEINYEIIVVDNASTDNTAELAIKTWKGKPELLRVITEKKPGLSYARMAGLAASKYDLINFIDDDNLVNENWLFLINDLMRSNKKIGMLGGLGIPKSNAALPDWFEKYRDAYAVGPQGKKSGVVSKERSYLHGAGLSIRKKIWAELEDKGFKFYLTGRKGKSLSSGEDFELSSAVQLLGYELYYDERLIFDHLISDDRLNKDYVLNLYAAFGNASNIVHAYKNIVSGNSMKERIKYNIFMTSIIYSLYKSLEFSVKRIFIKDKTDIYNNTIVFDIYWKNNFYYKITHINRTSKALKDIKKFARNCEE